MFRQAPVRELPAGHVVHGPFPARLRYFGIALAFSFVGSMMTLMALMNDHFVCPAAGTCTLDDRPMFDRTQLVGVHTEVRRGSKNAKYGVVVFDLAGGGRRESMHADPDDADKLAARVRSAIAGGAAFDETLYGPRFLAPIGLAAVVFAFVSFVLGLSKMGRFDLFVEGSKLHVRRSLYAIPLGTRQVSLDRVTEVKVERGTVPVMLRQRYEQLPAAGRLLLVYRDGTETPLTPGLFQGHALHLRTAKALRAALRLDTNARDDEELARIPMRTWPASMRFGFVWAGLCTGSILGLAVFGLSLWAFGLTSLRANIEGWMVAIGSGGGAMAGAALALHWTRPRLPR